MSAGGRMLDGMLVEEIPDARNRRSCLYDYVVVKGAVVVSAADTNDDYILMSQMIHSLPHAMQRWISRVECISSLGPMFVVTLRSKVNTKTHREIVAVEFDRTVTSLNGGHNGISVGNDVTIDARWHEGYLAFEKESCDGNA